MSDRNSVFAGYPWTRKCNVCAHTPNKYLLYEWVHGQKDLQRRRKDAGVRGERSSCWLPGSWFGFWFLILPRPKVLPWVPGNLISLIKRRFYFCLHGFLLCATQGPPTPPPQSRLSMSFKPLSFMGALVAFVASVLPRVSRPHPLRAWSPISVFSSFMGL